MKTTSAIAAILLLLFSLSPAPACAAQAADGAPTTITSQRMEYNTNTQTVVFTRDVHVVRPDMEIWSDQLTLSLNKNQTAGATSPSGAPGGQAGLSSGDIEKIVAEKNVRIQREGRRGECQKATYTVANDLLTMEGSPRLFEGENSITGEKILFYLKENRSEVIGAPDKPVQVIFTSGNPSSNPAATRNVP